MLKRLRDAFSPPPVPSTPAPAPASFREVGSTGVDISSGWVNQAYTRELTWPSCIPLYNRLWRSDPECTVARMVLETLSSQLRVGVEIPSHSGSRELGKPSDDDKKAQEFLYQVLDDMEGGISTWVTSCLSRVPFYGWGWWEVLNGYRKEGWSSPDANPWESDYDDGLIGIRKLAFRHYSSFFSWDVSRDGKYTLQGMNQLATPLPLVTIPLDRSLHVRFGDRDNPEGLATLEGLWRLERLKYGLELVEGIGFEHSAGYLDVKSDKPLNETDRAHVKASARAVMTAQEGNYALWPSGFTGELKDVPFQSATSILDAIRYYGILKLALFGVQWAALGTLSSYGSYSSMRDASSLFLMTFNSMADGFISQLDQQVGKRLFTIGPNASAFPGMTRRPRIVLVRKVEKGSSLTELGQFIAAISTVLPLDDEDIVAIRRASEVLPEHIPEHGKILSKPPSPSAVPSGGLRAPSASSTTPKPGEPVKPGQNPTQIPNAPGRPFEGEFRPFTVPSRELPTTVEHMAAVSDEDAKVAVREFKKWAQVHKPELSTLLDAQPIESDEES